MHKIYLILGCIFLLVAIFSCKPTLYTPTTSSVSSTATLENLIEGRELFIGNCGKCHKLYNPTKFTNEEWRKNVNEMQKRAHITDEQKELVYQYLISHPGKKKIIKY